MYTQWPLSATSSNRWLGRIPQSFFCVHGGMARSSAPAMMSVGVWIARYSGIRASRAANSRSCASVSWMRLWRLSLKRSKKRCLIPSSLSLYFSTKVSPKIFSYM